MMVRATVEKLTREKENQSIERELARSGAILADRERSVYGPEASGRVGWIHERMALRVCLMKDLEYLFHLNQALVEENEILRKRAKDAQLEMMRAHLPKGVY